MAEQSLLAIEEADVVLFMVDARAGLMPADIAIAKHLRSREKPTFLVANKNRRHRCRPGDGGLLVPRPG